ncbi:glucose-1-phosphate adenylyltransferase [Pumilibacter muris]|jgi:glucose-1-phosphate adenylyltransferase|uniref:glucose-1-phosphate adenylyltransferase n=1 Tax=Pumilibacter muris TaxID=2941510 RepID=UPI00203EBF2D|nr:glucose-1-phosphate adenylyltransferase [Pumilibacter muris]
MKKKKCVAMLLAGGQGTRLYALTSKTPKPAVSFGAKYRIIDFPLANCTNSGIDTVGVLTQYQPLILNEYIGTGEPWDLDRTYGGVHMLPPYQAKTGGEWYKGTANAIYQNLHFLNEFDSEHVLILSGDHIYKMDYSAMLSEHIEHDADCTISVIDVDEKEASRFGIMDFDADKRITSFEEKPKKPKSNHASMGIYIFKKDVLVSELIADENNPASDKDFGKNVIPTMLKEGKRMFAYSFKGYWKDVGTVASLWEANMDLLGENPVLGLSDSNHKIYSRNAPLPPTFIGEKAEVDNCVMTTGCEIYGKVKNSVIGEGVVIGEGSVVQDSVIMTNSVIGKNVNMRYGMVDENVIVGDGSEIGDEKSSRERIALIGRGKELAAGAKVASGEIVD